MRRRRQQPLSDKLFFVIGAQGLEQTRQVPRPKPIVNLRNSFGQLFFVSLGQTSCDVNALQLALSFGLGKAENGVNAFLFGRLDEAARIDNDNAAVVLFGLMLDFKVVRTQLSHHDLTVENVLGTS